MGPGPCSTRQHPPRRRGRRGRIPLPLLTQPGTRRQPQPGRIQHRIDGLRARRPGSRRWTTEAEGMDRRPRGTRRREEPDLPRRRASATGRRGSEESANSPPQAVERPNPACPVRIGRQLRAQSPNGQAYRQNLPWRWTRISGRQSERAKRGGSGSSRGANPANTTPRVRPPTPHSSSLVPLILVVYKGAGEMGKRLAVTRRK